MPQDLADALARAVADAHPALEAMPDAQASVKSTPEAWSPKEELGHLIDSATNNHVRFVRAALEPEFHGPTYDGNGWVRVHRYADLPWTALLSFWREYNRFLTGLIAAIPRDRLGTVCVIGSGAPVTLAFVIEDYILHMQHHIDHILGRERLTDYPGRAAGI